MFIDTSDTVIRFTSIKKYVENLNLNNRKEKRDFKLDSVTSKAINAKTKVTLQFKCCPRKMVSLNKLSDEPLQSTKFCFLTLHCYYYTSSLSEK